MHERIERRICEQKRKNSIFKIKPNESYYCKFLEVQKYGRGFRAQFVYKNVGINPDGSLALTFFLNSKKLENRIETISEEGVYPDESKKALGAIETARNACEINSL